MGGAGARCPVEGYTPILRFFAVFSIWYYSPEGSAKLRWEERGILYLIGSVPSGRIYPYVAIFRGFLLHGTPKRVKVLFYSPEGSAKLRWVGGGAQRPVLRVFAPKKTGAHSARAAKTTNVKIFFIV
jgi:hypothetical protein